MERGEGGIGKHIRRYREIELELELYIEREKEGERDLSVGEWKKKNKRREEKKRRRPWIEIEMNWERQIERGSDLRSRFKHFPRIDI